MNFFSILYETKEKQEKNASQEWMKFSKLNHLPKKRKFEYVGTRLVEVKEEQTDEEYPMFYEDLNIEQIMEEVLKYSDSDETKQIFYKLIGDESTILYRQHIMKCLEKKNYYIAFTEFQNKMKEILSKLESSQQTTHTLQSDKYYLDAIHMYCQTVLELAHFLEQEDITSEGLKLLARELSIYTNSEVFKTLFKQSDEIKNQLESISYTLLVSENQVQVRLGVEENNYNETLIKSLGEAILGSHYTSNTLNKITLFNKEELCPLEVEILKILESQYKQIFDICHSFVMCHKDFIELFIKQLSTDLNFYIFYINYMNMIKKKGFTFVYPQISLDKQVDIEGVYDLSLAQKMQSSTQVVGNDLLLKVGETGAWITGANQGGKTTFARSIGQAVYFAALGLPIAAEKAILPLYKQIYTHFSEIEDEKTSNGKLKEELLKLKPVIKMAGTYSLVIMNELFSSTTANDAYEMSKYAVEHLISSDATVISVTHVTALAREGKGMVSMVAEIDKNQSSQRTYKITRKEADGLAYASNLVNKHHLTYQEIKERITYEN